MDFVVWAQANPNLAIIYKPKRTNLNVSKLAQMLGQARALAHYAGPWAGLTQEQLSHKL